MIRHPAVRAVLDCLDITGEIVSFIDLHALLPVLLSDPRLRDAVRRILGPDGSLISDQRFFVTSVPLTQWAICMGCITEGLSTSAALSGSMDVLRWLRKKNDPPCPWSESTFYSAAAEGGHLHVLKWLREENDLLVRGMNLLVLILLKGGHLHVMKWLREENDPPCPWDDWTCAYAAERGHLHVLKWLREENNPPCPWDPWICVSDAAKGGHLHVLKWLREENDPSCP
jgi:hypothetical protein